MLLAIWRTRTHAQLTPPLPPSQIMCLGASSDEASSEEAFDPTAEHMGAVSDSFNDFSD